jgi:hypothetical protein
MFEHLTLSPFAALSLCLVACGLPATKDSAVSTQAETTSAVFTCADLGTNDTSFVELEDGAITVTFESVGTADAKELRHDARGTTYGDFSPAGLLFFAGETLVVPTDLAANGSGTIEVDGPNGGHGWNADCHRATSAELHRDHCLPQVNAINPVDAGGSKPQVSKELDDYRITIPSRDAGDFVYLAKATANGLVCKVTDVIAKSCSAIVANAILARASDGQVQFAGDPYVQKIGETEYKGGIHDVGSGEFAYVVETTSSSDDCTVKSVEPD